MDMNLFKNQNSEKYLLQINRIKLQNYVQYGLIVPDKYLDDEHELDIQSKNPEYLIVSNGYVDVLSENQILIELVFTDYEKNKLIKKDDVYYFDFPLPLTRIKKIYAQDKEIINHICVNLENSEKGFLPKNIFDVYNKKDKNIFDQISLNDISAGLTNDYNEKIIKYDKLLGMLSFMKNTNLYYCDDIGIVSNYSDNYFVVLSNFLKTKFNEKKFILNSILNKNKDFKELLFSNKIMDKLFLEKISESINNPQIKNIFLELLKPNSTRKTLYTLLEKDEKELYLISLIYYFRQKESNRKDNFKIDMKSLIPYEIAELSLALLGIYLGYRNLRSEEFIEIKDIKFKKIFGNTYNIKFKLDNKLDYITLESIYNYVFNDKEEGYEFPYLSHPIYSNSIKLLKDEYFKLWYKTEINEYFGEKVYRISKNTKADIIEDILSNYPEKIDFGYFLLTLIYKRFNKFIKLDDNIPYCIKSEIFECLEKIDITQLKAISMLDIK